MAYKTRLPEEVIAAVDCLNELVEKHKLLYMLVVCDNGSDDCDCGVDNCGAIKYVRTAMYTAGEQYSHTMLGAMQELSQELEATIAYKTPSTRFH